mmetsp:Transcript_30446/g.87841  ORF Transcript_30446/g.87841 Transcript_30446/m.87841 type:complete len:244 (+) Transcript_30446:454-1185(+)
MRVSGIPTSSQNSFSAAPASALLLIGPMSTNARSVKSCAQVFPLIDFTFENKVSVYHFPGSLLASFPLIKSVRYRRTMGCTADLIPFCVVAFNVSFAVSRPMFHFFAKVSAEIGECRVLDVTDDMTLPFICRLLVPATCTLLIILLSSSLGISSGVSAIVVAYSSTSAPSLGPCCIWLTLRMWWLRCGAFGSHASSFVMMIFLISGSSHSSTDGLLVCTPTIDPSTSNGMWISCVGSYIPSFL